MVRQAVWADLGRALAAPIDSTSTLAVAQETEGLLRAMGCESQMYPSTMALADWSPTEAATALSKWKRKLRSAFGTTGAGVAALVFGSTTYLVQTEADPSRVPLPPTPQKGTTDENEASFTTPNTRRTTVRPPERRFEARAREESSDSDEDRFDPDYYDGDQTGEWARQVMELSASNGRSNTPRLEIATHLPLGNIKPFLGTRNKSERSMQWLRKFMYEMKGTHTPTNEWCMAFELSLQDGALHWYRQLPRKTKRTWKLLSDAFIKYYCSKFTQSAKARYYSAKREDKEHVCDYLNRLNGASDGDHEDSQSAPGYGRDVTEAGGQHDKSYDADEYSDAESDASEVSADAHGHVDATNDNERRAAAAGTFARPDNRRQSGGSNQFQRDREGRRQYGSCAACDSPYHSVHYCNRRCKLCKQVHDAGKCDALRELTSLLRTKVDKKDLTPELQSLVFGVI
ncbi:hypothetical protein PR001_g26307 [Phytophthora rubi]|uniref:Retrotransposon gag domain-containing protein n=1 Tax=Phytophthora rubi TaxID=129364 RepID=A0A6A3HUS6_9STRA|nr:hypothetical protein PR001_g26307 [Phytophthora rubi]